MTADEFKGFIAMLEQPGKTYGAEVRKRIWAKISEHPVKAMRDAVDRLLMEHTYPPPGNKIVDAVEAEVRRMSEAAAIKREEDAAREKEEARQGMAKAFHDPKQIAKQSLLLIRAIHDGKITRGQMLEQLRALDAMHPGAGFATTGAKLAQHYERKNLALDRVPNPHYHLEGICHD